MRSTGPGAARPVDDFRSAWLGLVVLLMLTAFGCAASVDEDVGSLGEALCSGTTLISDATGPVTDTVTLTAQTSCALGETPEYLFRYRSVDSTRWLDLGTWSPSSSFLWHPAGLAPGRYVARVRARASGQTTELTSSRALELFIGEGCQVGSFASNVASPQPVGAIVDFTATSTCSSGSAEYRYDIVSPTGEVRELRGWDANPSVRWETAGLVAGMYNFAVSLRRIGNSGYDAAIGLSFKIGETCRSPRLTPSLPSPVSPGTIVSLQASASCTGTAQPEFRFSYVTSAPASTVVIRDWSSAAAASWDTTGLEPNDYQLRLDTRANDGVVPSQASRKLMFAIASCGNFAAQVTSSSGVSGDRIFTVRGNATCTPGVSPEYRVSYQEAISSVPTLLQDWSTQSEVVWNTSGVPWNNYSLKMEMRANNAAGPALSAFVAPVVVGKVCDKIKAFFATRTGSETSHTVRLEGAASVSCTDYKDAPPEFRFSYIPPDSDTPTEILGWTPAPGQTPYISVYANDIQGPDGRYQFILEVRAIGSQVTYQVRRIYPLDLGYICRSLSLSARRIPASGTKIIVRSQTSCTSLPAEHDFFYRRQGTADWIPLQTGATDTVSWDTAGLAAGNYELRVDVRVAQHSFTDTRTTAYTLCTPGYDANGGTVCTDIDECSTPVLGASCDPLATCTNTPGGRICGPCPLGYSGAGESGCVAAAPSLHFRSLSAGRQFTCGITENGSIACWGLNNSGQASPPGGTFEQVTAAGGSYACGVRDTGAIVCWGGLPSFCRWEAGAYLCGPPTLSGEDYTRVATSDRLICGLRTDGTVSCAGDNWWPTWLTGVTALEGNAWQLCALQASGTAVCWGSVSGGPPAASFTAIAVSERLACGMRADKSLECWGYTPLLPFGEFTAIAGGGAERMCGVRAGGSVECFGGTPFGAPGAFTSLAVGDQHTCALRADGSVACWGNNSYGQATVPLLE